MNRAFILLAVLACIFVTVIGSGWVQQPPSNQELLANFAKAKDYVLGAQSVRGWPWWSPNYMQGTSLAGAFSTGLSNFWLYAWSLPFGEFTGPKIAGLLCIIAAALSMFLFARRLTGSDWAAFACGTMYLFLPGILIRLGYVEHMNVVCSFVFIPLAFWGVLRLIEKPSILSALACGAAYGALSLAYTKTAALTLPGLALFAIWAWRARAHGRIPAFPIFLCALGAVFLFAAVPNLPSIREARFMALFELSPFEGWQKVFSTKSGFLWLDRDNILSNGMPDGFVPKTSQGGNYLGVVPFLLLAALALFRRGELYRGNFGSLFRLFAALTLLAHWLSFGPRSVLGGQLEFLRSAINAPNGTVPVAWLLLAAQVWFIFLLPPKELPGRTLISVIVSAIYLLVPGFRLLQCIPLYANIRAPQDFYQTTGVFCAAVLAGIAATILLRDVTQNRWRGPLATLAIVFMIGDISAYLRPFFKGPLDAGVFRDFTEAQNYLSEKAEVAGRVMPCSGRYFYLLTPLQTGRGLTTEAFNSYLGQRRMNRLLMAGMRSAENLRTFFEIGGVAYVLIDKKDPDTPADYQQHLRSILPVAFENEHFAILENKNSLAPAFLATNFVQTQSQGSEIASSSLTLAKYSLATLEVPPLDKNTPGLAGSLEKKGAKVQEKQYPAFQKLEETGSRTANYQRILIAPAKQKGWVIIPEAYHPDWRAQSGGKMLTVHPAFEGLMGVQTEETNQPVELTFRQPWWYNICASVGALSWAAYGLLCLFTLSPLCTTNLRKRLKAISFYGDLPESNQGLKGLLREITQPLIVIPTYNEADTLPRIIDAALQAVPSANLLIVDDNSPDGTAALVEKHVEYDKRLHLLKRKDKAGLGSAYREGFQWALERDYDACIEMDADFSHDPADIPRLIAALNEGADIAIGSRYLGGVRVINWPQHRLFLSTGASNYVRTITGMPLTDPTSGFKAIRHDALRALNWSQFKAEGYGFQIELHYFLWRMGFTMVEVPIIFTERRQGQTKMSIAIAVEAAIRVLQLAFQGRQP